MSDDRLSKKATPGEIASARIAEKIAIILGLAVALRLLIAHSLGTVWLVAGAIALALYAYSVNRRRSA